MSTEKIKVKALHAFDTKQEGQVRKGKVFRTTLERAEGVLKGHVEILAEPAPLAVDAAPLEPVTIAPVGGPITQVAQVAPATKPAETGKIKG